MMRVLVISAAFPPLRAGESDHAFHLCRKLADSGLDVHILTGTSNAGIETGFTTHSIMSDWSWRDFPKLARFIRKCTPDAVILIYSSWIYKYHPMITFAPSLSKKILPHVQFVTQFEVEQGARMENASVGARLIRKGVKQWSGPPNVDWEFGTLLRDSDTIIVLSDDFRKKFSPRLPQIEKKTLLLPPPPIMHVAPEDDGATRRRGRALLGVKPGEFLLAYFGYVYEEKGVDTLIKALAAVVRRKENVRLVIIGGTQDDSEHDNSYAHEMSVLAEGLGIAEKIIWTGKYPTDSDYGSVCLRSADACVLPFDRGVTLNRSSFSAAVAHGLPTITTKGDALEPQFQDRCRVMLCPPKNPEALADRILELVENRELRENLRAGSLELAAEWFSWDKAVKVTLAALEGTYKPNDTSAK